MPKRIAGKQGRVRAIPAFKGGHKQIENKFENVKI
jgi:hypothetical protein